MPGCRTRKCLRIGAAALALMIFISASPLRVAGQTSVTTYHYDNYRTGWNRNESALTPATVNKSSFGLLQSVTLDDQVDAQPLVVPGVIITAGQYRARPTTSSTLPPNTIRFTQSTLIPVRSC